MAPSPFLLRRAGSFFLYFLIVLIVICALPSLASGQIKLTLEGPPNTCCIEPVHAQTALAR